MTICTQAQQLPIRKMKVYNILPFRDALCYRGFEPATDITMHVVAKKHYFKIF